MANNDTNPRQRRSIRLSNRNRSSAMPPPPREVLFDDRLLLDACCNCKRCSIYERGSEESRHCPYKLRIVTIDLALDLVVRPNNRRTFCFISFADYPQQNGSRPAAICGQCYSYLSNPVSAGKQDGPTVWPAFIWSSLHNVDTGRRAWQLLPSLWKRWWLRSFSVLHQINHATLMGDPSLFTEMTAVVERDLDALKNLRWSEDLVPCERSFVLAEIKCPCGCCEWKHKANSLPLDIVWEYCLDSDLRLYTDKAKRMCCNWFRPDYTIQESLLLNTSWKSVPSIAVNRDSVIPMVLCCRYHDATNTKHMLHPCRFPHVPIATEKSSQFTPVTPIPRTLRKAQQSTYSASFQIAKMEGCFSGLDTMFLSADGGYPFYISQSNLAFQHELLAYAGRSDLRAHLATLCDRNVIPIAIPISFQQEIERRYPNMDLFRSAYKHGANYVKIDDAVRLQHNLFYGRDEFTRIRTGNGPATRLATFSGTWPRQILNVHPAGSKHGARMPRYPVFQRGMKINNGYYDCRSGWLLVSMLVSVPELWAETVKAYKTADKWEGWVLTFCTSYCFPHLALSGTKDNPFKKLNQCDLFRKHIQPDYNLGYDPKCIMKKFDHTNNQRRTYANVLTLWDSPVFDPTQAPSGLGLEGITIQIVLRKNPGVLRNPIFLSSSTKEWELRYIALSGSSDDPQRPNLFAGSIYARHGGVCHPDWWRQTCDQDRPQKQPEGWQPANMARNRKSRWTACVYVLRQSFIPNEIRNMVLGACGGQTKIVCSVHSKPLIILVPSKKRFCSCSSFYPIDNVEDEAHRFCGAPCKYVCPEVNCYTGICNNHYVRSRTNPFQCPAMTEEHHNVLRAETQTTEGSTVRGQQNDADNNPNPYVIHNIFGLDDLDHTDHVPDDVMDQTALTMYQDPPVEFPTTNASTEPIFTSVTASEFIPHVATNHALLNFYGSCLIRRNSRLSGSVTQQSFLQKIASINYGDSIPLVYPEGMLFSDVFFGEMEDCSVIGAVPASHLHGDKTLKANGFCGLLDTYRTRMGNPALLSSANPKYHFFIFDALANFSLRGNDSRVVLRRGFAEQYGTGGVRFHGSKEPIFNSEHVENRAVVCKLSASTGEKMPTYFYTHSLSMRTHYGMKILWEWLTGDEVMERYCTEESEPERAHWRKSLIDSAGVYLLRAWMEICEIWLLYITKSPEQPAGPVTEFFARMELQDAFKEDSSSTHLRMISKGNLPHMHCLFWTADDLSDPVGLFVACDRIRGFVDDLIRPDEERIYIQKGIFKGPEDIMDFKATMARFLKHEHRRRCFVLRKNQITGVTEFQRVCKAHNGWHWSDAPGEHVFKDCPAEHTQESIRVMIDLGVADGSPSAVLNPNSENQYFEFIPLLQDLVADKHIPPCRGNEGLISPVLGALVAINPNSDNCQLANGYFVARYLAKYVVKIDEYCVVNIKPPQATADQSTFETTPEHLLNTKIASNRIAQGDKLSRGHNNKQKNSIGINVAEVYMMIFGYPSVYTNLEHVKFCTSLYGDRPGRPRKRKPIDVLITHNPTLQNQALTPINTVPAHHARTVCSGIQPWRHFTETQILKAFDDLHSPVSPDPVTIFGFRPPELRFVMRQPCFFRWFKVFPPTEKVLVGTRYIGREIVGLPRLINFCVANVRPSSSLELTLWITADSKVVRMRAAAIKEVLLYLRNSPLKNFRHGPLQHFLEDTVPAREAKENTMSLFQLIANAIHFVKTGQVPDNVPNLDPVKDRFKRVYKRFVCDLKRNVLPTPWTHPPKPTHTSRFLIHLLFRFGDYTDEYSLFQHGSLRTAYISSGLLNPANPGASATKLMKTYFLEELKHLPAGTPTFDRYCVFANNAIKDFFYHGTFHSDEIPSVLYCRLRTDTSREVAEYAEKRTVSLVTNILSRLQGAGFRDLPSLKECLQATVCQPCPWDIAALTRPNDQPVESFAEHMGVLTQIKEQIHSYLNPGASSPHGVCIVGGGGVGKTTCALAGLLYARCRGLRINATALVSERAQELGVLHLNNDYAMPRANLNQITPGQLAERTIGALYRQPNKLAFHRSIDVEVIDEMGPIPAEMWSARDSVLRYIRNSNRTNGGKLDLITFDHLQMHPVEGSHPLLSPLLTSSNKFMNLVHSVRTFHPAWRRIQAISRMVPHLLNEEVEAEFVHLVSQNCSFVSDESQVAPDVLFVFGKNKPIKMRQEYLYDSLGSRPNVIVSAGVDEEKAGEGRFRTASKQTSKQLDNKVRTQQKLFFFQGARFRVTYNKPNCFSNGQLAFMATIPDNNIIQAKRPIPLLLSPPGCTYLPTAADNAHTLASLGWTPVSVGLAPEAIVNIGNIRAKRSNQYGLQPYVGSTWHSTMGKTLMKLATKVDNSKGGKGPYSIWDPTQVVIMLSRTKLPGDTIFVSDDPQGTARTLFQVLRRTSPFRDYLSYLLHQLCTNVSSDVVPVLDRRHSVYRPQDVLLPGDMNGFAYAIISTKDSNFVYIGSCQNLVKRYEAHNQGIGAIQSAPASLRPWGLLAFVSGFNGDKNMYTTFENQWLARKQDLAPGTVSLQSLLDIGVSLCEEYKVNYPHLNFVFQHAGTLVSEDVFVSVSSSSEDERQSSEDAESSDPRDSSSTSSSYSVVLSDYPPSYNSDDSYSVLQDSDTEDTSSDTDVVLD